MWCAAESVEVESSGRRKRSGTRSCCSAGVSVVVDGLKNRCIEADKLLLPFDVRRITIIRRMHPIAHRDPSAAMTITGSDFIQCVDQRFTVKEKHDAVTSGMLGDSRLMVYCQQADQPVRAYPENDLMRVNRATALSVPVPCVEVCLKQNVMYCSRKRQYPVFESRGVEVYFYGKHYPLQYILTGLFKINSLLPPGGLFLHASRNRRRKCKFHIEPFKNIRFIKV